MSFDRRTVAALVVTALIALLFARLGVWQLERRSERRAENARVTAQLGAAPVEIGALPGDPAELSDRRVLLEGALDYEHELVHVARTRNGAPGVHVLTPLRIPGRDTAVLVNRGWTYSPDGFTVDLSRIREEELVAYSGYVMPLTAAESPVGLDSGRTVQRLTRDAAAVRLPYPIAPFVVIVTGGDAPPSALLARLQQPVLEEGPHLSYAIQWFAFAAIAVIGMVVLLRHDRRRATGEVLAPGKKPVGDDAVAGPLVS